MTPAPLAKGKSAARAQKKRECIILMKMMIWQLKFVIYGLITMDYVDFHVARRELYIIIISFVAPRREQGEGAVFSASLLCYPRTSLCPVDNIYR